MDINTLLLTAAALLPAIVLCIYVFKKDRVEKEPISLLLLLFFLGAVSCFPAAYIEDVLTDGINVLFGITDETVLVSNWHYNIYKLVYYFVGVALVEEGIKFFILKNITQNHKDFNCLFDGLIYAIFVSLGFAALENVFYVLENGWANAFLRGVLSVPGHMFFAVMMGYNYSRWHIATHAAELENQLAEDGIIEKRGEFNAKKHLVTSLAVPIAAHGFYNYCCSTGSVFAMIVLLAFVLFMYITCFGKIKKMSAADAFSNNYAVAIVAKKYHEYAEFLDSQNKTE